MRKTKKEWIDSKRPNDDDRPDPVEYLASLSWTEQNDFCLRQKQSKHWKELCHRVHRWTAANGYGCSIDQTEQFALCILVKFIAAHRSDEERYNANLRDVWSTMKEASFKQQKTR